MLSPIPATVRCNRGLGRWFWICIGIIALVIVVAMLGSGKSPWVMALIGLGAAGLFILTRAFLPSLTIFPSEQLIRTRRRVVPYAAVAAIDFRRPEKAGIWVNFIGDERRRPIACWASDETLMAPAGVEQWAEVRGGKPIGASACAHASAPGRGRRAPLSSPCVTVSSRSTISSAIVGRTSSGLSISSPS